MKQSRCSHILELSQELLDDIELSRLSGEQLILKASRLARLSGPEEVQKWLSLELGGYINTPIGKKYMAKTGRWINRVEETGYWDSLAQLEAALESNKLKLQTMSIANASGNYEIIAINNVIQAINITTNNISKYESIKSRVLAQLHNFVTSVYYDKMFDSLSESIFETYKSDVDELITEYCGEVIQQIPFVMDRLSDGDSESVSQALNTCRRIIDSFADSVFPAQDETLEIDGNHISLKADKTQNRINAFINNNCESKSRKKKIKQNLSNLYDRVSTGVHKRVDVYEAKSLFLNTYLILGEILTLNKK
ncbi:hypothetical protein V1499_11205 [Neobacillus sp. SCS-31]|uniref:AbiTii domain-containing protein n=1 Tax=Neobacillus oceani TaxID=3115292 RepID=UPI00390699ED